MPGNCLLGHGCPGVYNLLLFNSDGSLNEAKRQARRRAVASGVAIVHVWVILRDDLRVPTFGGNRMEYLIRKSVTYEPYEC